MHSCPPMPSHKDRYSHANGFLKRHERSVKAHPNCHRECPGFALLGDSEESGSNGRSDMPSANGSESGSTVRALFVLFDGFDLRDAVADNRANLFPLSFAGYSRSWLRGVVERARGCHFVDEETKTVYVHEWVGASSLLIRW